MALFFTPQRKRRVLQVGGRLFLRAVTRLQVSGSEHLNHPGPMIFAANHLSTFDALLLISLLPPDTTFVGPGDFKLVWPGNWVIDFAELIPMKRGAVDRDGLKRMRAVLQAGGRLAMFPEGGTWEKPIDDVKTGAAYLSQITQAPIVPMGFSHTYHAWDAVRRLERPSITVRIGAPLPPVAAARDRQARQDVLQQAALDLMQAIYGLLEPSTQALYDRFAHTTYDGRVVCIPPLTNMPELQFGALAELVSKPNLFRPLHRNVKLPVEPLLHHSRYYPSVEMRRAATALLAALEAGDFANYLEYRLGDAKAVQVKDSLRVLAALAQDGERMGARMAFFATERETAS